MPKKNPVKAQYIRQQIARWDNYWKINRDQYHLFMNFVMGNQWTEDESRVFENYRKIPMTMNKCAPLINHLLGEQRQNTPNLQVYPEDHVDEQTAETREAIVKDITLGSHASVVYQTAFQQAAVGGFGAYFISTEYESENSFNQNPVFGEVKDPTRCFWDIGCETPCKTDGMYSGFRTRFTRKKFASIYGKKLEKQIPTSTEDYNVQQENSFLDMADEDSITIIDWFERESKLVKKYLLNNGQIIEQKELDSYQKIDIEGVEIRIDPMGQPIQIVDERDVPIYSVVHSKWAGDYELESTDFPSEQLPVIFVDQNSYWDKKGRQICRPFLKDAKDAQKYINYLATQSAYLLKISRYDQFLVSKANVKSADTETIWRDPSTVQGGLVYDESPNGNKPEQLRPPELSASLVQQYERALMDIQTSTGMYNTQLGEQGNEVSGAAIDARTRRGSYNTFVPFDSLNRAIAVGGEIINEMIPKLYDTERTLKLNIRDSGLKTVQINKPVDDYSDQRTNDMTKGNYKIRLMPGPSYEGQKQVALQSMQQVLQGNPQLFNLIADLFVENLPLANNIELKNRLRTVVPSQIIQAGKTGQPLPPQPPQPDPQALQVQLKQQELQMKMQQAQMQAQQKEQELGLKQQELAVNARESSQNIMMDWQRLQNEKEEIAANLKDTELRYQAEIHKAALNVHMGHANNISDIIQSTVQHSVKPENQLKLRNENNVSNP